MKKLHLAIVLSIVACSSSHLFATAWQEKITSWNTKLRGALALKESNQHELAAFKSYAFLDLYLKEFAKARGSDFRQTVSTTGIRGVSRKFKDPKTASLLFYFFKHAQGVSKLISHYFHEGSDSINSDIKTFLKRFQKITARTFAKSNDTLTKDFKEIRDYFKNLK